ncbi:MAG: CotH kinase family protein, partial [Nannocystaceae bacterium]|nr:CotH kinase family protein [Nannocystaceae bacterium]
MIASRRTSAYALAVALLGAQAAGCTDTGASQDASGTEGSTGSGDDTTGTDASHSSSAAASTETSAGQDTESASGFDDGSGESTGTGPQGVDWDAAFDHVFPQDHVVQLTISPAPGGWNALLSEWDNVGTKSYYEASLSFDAEAIDSVGFRIKGWSSLDNGSGPGGGPSFGSSQPGGKFPLKIDFDRFDGPRFHDVNKVNLGNNWADLSYMRERLTNRLYLAMGVPAARTAYARVTVEGHNNGLYTAVQQIDRCFLEEHFGDDNGDGNLYKAVFTQTDIGALTWQGPNKADYVSSDTCPSGAPCGLVLKTNEDDPTKNDYADLIGFLEVLNQTPDPQFEAAIQEVFDVDAFLRLAAVSVVTSSFDGYLGMGHNYYLYNRPDTGRFMMLPWDHNESYAGHPCGANAVTFDINTPVCDQRGHNFVLAYRIFDVPTFSAQYRVYVQELVDTVFTEAQHIEWINEFNALIQEHIADDPNYIQSSAVYERSLGYDPPSPDNLGGHGG